MGIQKFSAGTKERMATCIKTKSPMLILSIREDRGCYSHQSRCATKFGGTKKKVTAEMQTGFLSCFRWQRQQSFECH